MYVAGDIKTTKMSANIVIREGSIAEAVLVSQQIPEFINPHSEEEYQKCLSTVPHLILIAIDRETQQPVGFKVGYQSTQKSIFYSWMGGILPQYRRMGIAQRLANTQEQWARDHHYTHIRFKTRNRLKQMLIFALSNGFDILEVIRKDTQADYRILLQKEILSNNP